MELMLEFRFMGRNYLARIDEGVYFRAMASQLKNAYKIIKFIRKNYSDLTEEERGLLLTSVIPNFYFYLRNLAIQKLIKERPYHFDGEVVEIPE